MRINHLALRAIRERTELTQSETARRAGINRPNYAHIEAGRRNATATQIKAIAAALKVPVPAILLDETEAA